MRRLVVIPVSSQFTTTERGGRRWHRRRAAHDQIADVARVLINDHGSGDR